jgi:hypothetical protein
MGTTMPSIAGSLLEDVERAQDSLRSANHPSQVGAAAGAREGYIDHAAAVRLYDALAGRFKAWTGTDLHHFKREAGDVS